MWMTRKVRVEAQYPHPGTVRAEVMGVLANDGSGRVSVLPFPIECYRWW